MERYLGKLVVWKDPLRRRLHNERVHPGQLLDSRRRQRGSRLPHAFFLSTNANGDTATGKQARPHHCRAVLQAGR